MTQGKEGTQLCAPTKNPPTPPLKKGYWARGTRFFAKAQNDTRQGGHTAVRPYEKSPYAPFKKGGLGTGNEILR